MAFGVFDGNVGAPEATVTECVSALPREEAVCEAKDDTDQGASTAFLGGQRIGSCDIGVVIDG